VVITPLPRDDLVQVHSAIEQKSDGGVVGVLHTGEHHLEVLLVEGKPDEAHCYFGAVSTAPKFPPHSQVELRVGETGEVNQPSKTDDGLGLSVSGQPKATARALTAPEVVL